MRQLHETLHEVSTKEIPHQHEGLSTLLKGLMIALSMIIFASTGCDDEEVTGCTDDQSCARGMVCEDGACVGLRCEWIGECPGSGRTCIEELQRCSAKECGDELNGVRLECPEGLECNLEGQFLYSCAEPSVGPTSCTDDAGCVGAVEGSVCCSGVCAMTCDAPIEPIDMTPVPGGSTPPQDMGPAVEASLCTPCNNEATCASLGEGARCTPIGEGSFCTSACSGADDCPTGFTCLESLAQCVPANFACVACLQEPCSAGEFCDLQTGECGPPQALCGACTDDLGCAGELVCREINRQAQCVQACEGGCPTGTTCSEGGCIPDSGTCDPCAGMCAGDTPYCVEAEGRCAECGPGIQCGEGLRCDLQSYTCTDALPNGMCVTDMDCQGGGLCFNGSCVECFQDSDCPARNTCNTNSFTCEYSACAGVSCQRGSTCQASTGKCTPGCTTSQDCALPDQMECNVATGQCYNPDGTCDLSGDAVCAPGGECMPNPLAAFDPTLPANCTCAKEDPMDPLSPDRIACHPGQLCNDLSALLGGLDLSSLGIEFDATCGGGL